MARIELDLVNYQDDNGKFDTYILHTLTQGLNVTFDDTVEIPESLDAILTSVVIEFTGSYEDLVMLIDRYEEDIELRPGLIADIEDIHS